MSYSDFNLAQISKIFNIEIQENQLIFTNIKEFELDLFFVNYLNNNIPLAEAIGTEKAKSEMIIAPVLIEVRRILSNQISLFSGIDFNVDSEKGLSGFCDFIISLSPQQLYLKSPLITLVEAKNDNIKSGLAQCMAEMIAAQIFNEKEDTPIPNIYGIVTNGNQWKFMKLTEKTITLDSQDYYIIDPQKIINLLVSIIISSADSEDLGSFAK